MKKIFIYFLSALAITNMASCVNYNDATTAVSVNVQVVAPEEFTKTGDLSGQIVTLTNNNKQSQQAITDANGIATFDDIIPDVYSISTSWYVTEDTYKQLTGKDIKDQFAVVSGSALNELIKGDDEIKVKSNLVIAKALVIGKIYYAGAKDDNNKNYLHARYIEIYNQSNEPVNVKGLYIGLVESNSTPAYTLEQLHSEYNDSVVMLKQIFQIPTDQDYMVEPGGTVLLTNSAIDHSTNGASSQPNLLTADFEAKDEKGKTINNPAVKGLNLIYTNTSGLSYMNILQSGPSSIVIFRTDANINDWPVVYNYGKTKGTQQKAMPKRFIIDAVEILKYKATGVETANKRFYNDLDAGYTNINSTTGYTGEVVYRKTSTRKGKDGHKILQDTNNSSDDFKVSTTIKIREYDD